MPISNNTVVAINTGGTMQMYEDMRAIIPINRSISLSSVTETEFSPDNTIYIIGRATNTVYHKYVNDEWVAGVILSSITGTIAEIEFSADSSVMMVATSTEINFYETAGMTLIHQETGYGTIYGAALSRDGLRFAVMTNSPSPYYFVKQLTAPGIGPSSSLPTPALSASTSRTSIRGCCFNADGSELVVNCSSGTTSVGIQVVEVASGTLLTGITTSVSTARTTGRPRLSADDQSYAIPMNQNIGILNSSTYAIAVHPIDNTTKAPNLTSTPLSYKVKWYDDLIYVGSSNTPLVSTMDRYTGEWGNFVHGETTNVFCVASPQTGYQITGSIVESLTNDTWLCAAYSLSTGVLLNSVVTNTNTFTINLANNDQVMLVVSAHLGNRWEPDTTYTLGDFVYPTNPDILPYYYKCVGTGVSLATEPTWSNTVGSTVNDGTVVWELIDRVIQPTAHMPLTPQPV